MISLLGSLLGFGTGFMPKVLDFFQAKQNMKHELLLQENKIKMAKELSALKIKEETVVLDANHPLAGKDLIFELEVLEVSNGKKKKKK